MFKFYHWIWQNILTYFVIYFIILIASSSSINAQTQVCIGDTVFLELPAYSGSIQWQESSDSILWSNIANATYQPYSIIAASTKYYRAMITQSTCNPFYSGIEKFEVSTLPLSTPAIGNHTISPTQIIWHWNAVSNATGYKCNTSNNYLTAINIDNSLNQVQINLTCNTQYSIYIWAYDRCGNVSLPLFITANTSACPFVCGTSTISDIEGNNYNTLSIGTQCWMKENLRTSKFRNNVSIPIAVGDNDWMALSTSAYCEIDSNASNSPVFGKLYNWYAVADNNGICPSGWHVPSHFDWTILQRAICESPNCDTDFPFDFTTRGLRGTNEGNSLKETGFTHWSSGNTGTNNSGFTALGGGNRNGMGRFTGFGDEAYFWTSTEKNQNLGWLRNLSYSVGTINVRENPKIEGYSVRCVKNECTSNPASPVQGTHTPNSTEIIWTWEKVNGATGYKWNTSNDYNSALELLTDTVKLETGLLCNMQYTRYVWAYNPCGASAPQELTATTIVILPTSVVASASSLSLCNGQTLTLSGNTSGAVMWSWTGPNNFSSNLQNPDITNVSEINSGIYTLTASNDCGSAQAVSTANIVVSSQAPASVIPGTHVSTSFQIIWHWNPVAGAAGYKGSKNNTPQFADDLGNVTMLAQNGFPCNTVFNYYIWAYDNCGNMSPVTIFSQSTASCTFTCGTSILADREGNVYNSVAVGTQCWMKENLRTTKYNLGSAIPNITDNSAWSGLTSGAYCDYYNTPSNANIYGRLYNWYAATSSNYICPEGWHLPTDAEWNTLEKFLESSVDTTLTGFVGTSIGGKLKETGIAHWTNPNTGATNSSGFTALPSGNRDNNAFFNDMNGYAYWWTNSEYNSTDGWGRFLINSSAQINRFTNNKAYGFSIRCVRN